MCILYPSSIRCLSRMDSLPNRRCKMTAGARRRWWWGAVITVENVMIQNFPVHLQGKPWQTTGPYGQTCAVRSTWFQQSMIWFRNLFISFSNSDVGNNTGYGDENSLFFGAFQQPVPVRCNWIVFARKMHSTTKFAMTVLSKCVCFIVRTELRKGEWEKSDLTASSTL